MNRTDPTRPARRTALITGASAGIGASFARIFASHGFDSVLTARRRNRLEHLAEECRARWNAQVHIIPADLTDPAAPQQLDEFRRQRGIAVDALINNAGYGLPGRFLASEWKQHADFLQIMVTAVVELTHRLLPAMIERGYGRIVNVASLAGLVPATAGQTLYAPSKAFLITFSQSLALEVRQQGVHVLALCPGFTYTEFHDVNGTRQIVSQLPRWMWMEADEVARQGFEAVMAGRSIHVNGRVNRTIAFTTRYLPQRAMSWVTERQSRRYKKL